MASARLKALIAGLKDVLGEEETLHMLSNALQAEEVSAASRKHSLEEIRAALEDARAAGAARWAWVAKRLSGG